MSKDFVDRVKRVYGFLEEGKQFTAEILQDNEALRAANLRLKSELEEAKQRAGAGSGREAERMATLERDNREMRAQLDALHRALETVEAANHDYATRHVRVERQNNNLASLYVATYNLHSTLHPHEVINNIREIVINLIGSEKFGIYAMGEEPQIMRLLSHEGLDETTHAVLRNTGIVSDALTSGAAVIGAASAVPTDGSPIACAPLVIHGQSLGVIVIFELLGHKPGFEPLDGELLNLLAGHAATALYSSKLYAQAERKLTTLQGFLELLRTT